PMSRPMTPCSRSLLLALFSLPAATAIGQSGADWPVYLGDKSASHYSTLDQIDRESVARLEVAWTWEGSSARDDRSQIQCNPLVIDGVVYGTDAALHLIALDGASGRLLWRLDPFEGLGDSAGGALNRGLAYWKNG